MQVSRTDARGVECPRCKAGRDDPCRDVDHQVREANHAERVARFVRGRAVRSTSLPHQMDRDTFRAQVRQIPCPVCHAEPNERCRSRRPKGRESVHMERIQAWRKL